MTLCVTACADKELQGTSGQENFTATTAAQGRTENTPEPSEKPDVGSSEKPSEESAEEPENPFTPHSSDLLSEEEKEQLQHTALAAAESVKELYKDSIIADTAHHSSGVCEFTSVQQKTVVDQKRWKRFTQTI